jgi:hypothetical protein
MILATKQISKL